jgi:hypothetical protein
VSYTVRVTLLGRRDGGEVVGVGESRTVGTFRTRALAEDARDAWLGDPSFAWDAEVKLGAGEVGVRVDHHVMRRCWRCGRQRGHALGCTRRWAGAAA